MKRQFSILLVMAFLLSLTYAIAIANEVPFGATVTDLIADGGSPDTAMDVGDVVVWNDADYVYVQYLVDEPWCLTKTHLHVAESLDMVPQTKKGNPIPGKFTYQAMYECVQVDPVIMIPLDYALCTDLVVAAHAVVEKTVNESIEPIIITETAWGAGDGFPGKNWSTYFSHLISEPEECSDGIDNDCDGLIDGEDIDDCQILYEIGDTGPAGGTVFYITDGGLHGLEAAPADQSSDAKWGCSGTEIAGADGTAVGMGAQNTADILAGCSESGIAAEVADTYSLSGYNDWFLPSQDELNLLYQQKDVVGGFANDFYWSSTEVSQFGARNQRFGDGYQGNGNRLNLYRVRAVRSF